MSAVEAQQGSTAERDRAGRLAAIVAERGLDVLLVNDLVNLRYLTGFTGTNGLALIGADTRLFVTDFRYMEQAAAQVDGAFTIIQSPRDALRGVPGALPEGARRVGFDDVHVSVSQHAWMRGALPDEVELIAAGGLVETLRAVKDAGELDRIRAAAVLADEALAAVLAGGLVGRTEREVAFELEHAIRLRGGEPSFAPIVAAGEHGARPHAVPREVAIPEGTLVVIDWGALLDGYCSDCTRTLATGALEAEAAEVYELVRVAQASALDAVRVGAVGRDVDAVAREIIKAGGYGEQFGHALGHGVGLVVHELPRLAHDDETALLPGHVVTVEPGVYLPGRFGVRIEDLVVVGADGPEVLSSVAKGLTTLS